MYILLIKCMINYILLYIYYSIHAFSIMSNGNVMESYLGMPYISHRKFIVSIIKKLLIQLLFHK